MTQLLLFNPPRMARPETYRNLIVAARETGCPLVAARLEAAAREAIIYKERQA